MERLGRFDVNVPASLACILTKQHGGVCGGKIPPENPWKHHFRDSKFQNVPRCLGPQELVPLCEFQSRLLLIISQLLKTFLTALAFTTRSICIVSVLQTTNLEPSTKLCYQKNITGNPKSKLPRISISAKKYDSLSSE